jgi:simple sugar transport system permease protein
MGAKMIVENVNKTRLKNINWKLWRSLIFGALIIAAILFFNARNPSETRAVLASTLRYAVPLILGALCGIFCERAGIVNIGIEGQMLLSAFTSYMTNAWTGNLALSLFVGMVTGSIMGLFLAFLSIKLKLNQVIGGTVINILAAGITGYFYQVGTTTKGKFASIPLGPLADIPIIGPLLFNNPPITYIAIVLVIISQIVLFNTRWGLRTRAVGEHPRAADTLGVDVFKIRYVNVLIGGIMAGLAGAFLTLEGVGLFERGMTNGRGFIALAVMIFGKWNPISSALAALFFGFANAMQTQLQFMGIQIAHQFVGMIPYLLTIIVVSGFVGRSRAPAAEGIPYEKE